MQVSAIGSQQLQQVYNQMKNQQASATQQMQAQQPTNAVRDPDHDGDTDGAGPDIDGKGKVIDFRA